MSWTGPILDNHLHLDLERGLGEGVVEDFVNAGGTHMLVVNKPSWWYGVTATEPADFAVGFEATIETVARASDLLPGRAWAVLGVHPALISRLIDRGYAPADAASIMRDGIDRAVAHVQADEALAIKSGRPHYEVDGGVMEAANDVIRHAFDRAASAECAVQLHTESGSSYPDLAAWADAAGLPETRVVKHYADGAIDGAIPSVIARRDAISDAVDAGRPFLMETDFLDDPDRPGAVLGPKTVPRRVGWLAEAGELDAIERAHVAVPRAIYGIDTHATLAT